MNTRHENELRRATLGDIISRSAQRYGERTAIIYQRESVSYSLLNTRACQAANHFLALGIKKGDRVALLTHNNLHAVFCRLGLYKIGAIPVLMNFLLRGDEIRYIIDDADAHCLLVEEELVEHIQSIQSQLASVKVFGVLQDGNNSSTPDNWVDTSEFFDEDSSQEPEIAVDTQDIATLMYTSGTEGSPKGVATTHFNYWINLLHGVIDYGQNRRDINLVDIPLFHVAATTVLHATLAVGGKMILCSAPDPQQTLQLTQEHGITSWSYPPTLYQALISLPELDHYDIRSLQRCIVFGATLPQVLWERWQEHYPNLEWRNKWGQTESTPLGATLWPEDFSDHIHSVGKPDFGVSVAVVDENNHQLEPGEEGELVLRGPSVMSHYWNQPEKTASTLSQGWLHTGDIGYIDHEGFVYFTDRKKDMIKSGGENVSSQEVEAILLRHTDVALVAVIGLPDEYWTEAVTAFVTLKPDAQVSADALREFCKERLAAYKVPKAVHIREQLPLTATGKIRKRDLRDESLKSP